MSNGMRLIVAGLAVLGTGSIVPREAAIPADFERREQVRIQAHFDSVLGELRGRDVATLGARQRARRERLIGVLSAYRDRGAFPHNYDFPGQLVPTFVDERTGVRCAVAHLLESTGRAEVVTRVAETNQHVYVLELGTDTAFTAWLGENGLTLEEASRIQVPYMGYQEPDQGTVNGTVPHKAEALVAGLVVGSVGVATWNLLHLDRPKTVVGMAGMALGAASFVVGNELGRSDRIGVEIGKTAMLTGIASAAAGAFSLLPKVRHANSHDRIAVAPTVDFSRSASSPSVGLAGRLRF